MSELNEEQIIEKQLSSEICEKSLEVYTRYIRKLLLNNSVGFRAKHIILQDIIRFRSIPVPDKTFEWIVFAPTLSVSICALLLKSKSELDEIVENLLYTCKEKNMDSISFAELHEIVMFVNDQFHAPQLATHLGQILTDKSRCEINEIMGLGEDDTKQKYPLLNLHQKYQFGETLIDNCVILCATYGQYGNMALLLDAVDQSKEWAFKFDPVNKMEHKHLRDRLEHLTQEDLYELQPYYDGFKLQEPSRILSDYFECWKMLEYYL